MELSTDLTVQSRPATNTNTTILQSLTCIPTCLLGHTKLAWQASSTPELTPKKETTPHLHICPQGQKHRRATFDRQRQQQLQRAQLHGRFARLQRHRHLHTCDRLIGVGGQLRHSFRLSLDRSGRQKQAANVDGDN
eukprot:1157805-Pelagomonas_calceolata.AAC.10